MLYIDYSLVINYAACYDYHSTGSHRSVNPFLQSWDIILPVVVVPSSGPGPSRKTVVVKLSMMFMWSSKVPSAPPSPKYFCLPRYMNYGTIIYRPN